MPSVEGLLACYFSSVLHSVIYVQRNGGWMRGGCVCVCGWSARASDSGVCTGAREAGTYVVFDLALGLEPPPAIVCDVWVLWGRQLVGFGGCRLMMMRVEVWSSELLPRPQLGASTNTARLRIIELYSRDWIEIVSIPSCLLDT